MILSLLQSHGITPKKKATTHGGEYASPCPRCGGSDRFLSWPEQGELGTWYCRGCDLGGDAIEFLREFDGLSFAEACTRLNVSRDIKRTPFAAPRLPKAEAKSFTPVNHPEASLLWQKKAAELVASARASLLASPLELEKLAHRGLDRDAVDFFHLGFLPGEKRKNGERTDCYYRDRAAWGLPEQKNKENGKPKKLWIPRGLVIPMLDEMGNVQRLRIRRPEADRKRFLPDMKFAVVTGSNMTPLLIAPPHSQGFVVVESELDAMACVYAARQAGLAIGALAVGTNRGKPDAIAHAALLKSLCILVALDFDTPDEKGNRPGAQGLAWWKATYRQAVRWPVPAGKDPGEAVALGVDLASWLQVGLPPVFSFEAVLSPSNWHTKAALPKNSMPVGCSDCGQSDSGSLRAKEATEEPAEKPVGKKKGAATKAAPQKTYVKKSWQGQGLPPNLPYTAPYLQNLLQGKNVAEDFLLPCPITKTPWWWVYANDCSTCKGHLECILPIMQKFMSQAEGAE